MSSSREKGLTLIDTGCSQAEVVRTAGLKEERCERCGIDAWRGGPLVLQLHHVNGEGLDNRLENLQLLCPNCHSQTENWGGRNRRRGVAGAGWWAGLRP